MRFTLFLLGFFIIFISSCKKDSTPENVVPVSNDSTLLSKVVMLDTTKPAPLDTMNVSYYMYDNSKRMISGSLYSYNSSGSIKESDIYKYFYTGSDTLPSKLVHTYADASEQSLSTSFYTHYPGTRNVLWDSTIHHETVPPYTFDDTLVNHYNYSTDFVTIASESYSNAGHQVATPYYIFITRHNGNIISQRDTISSTYIESFNCTYDTHKNPYYNVAWYNNLAIVSIFKYYPDGFGLNNNVTEINNTGNDLNNPANLEISHYKYSYKYREDGYPVEIIMKDLGSTTPTSTNKIKYYYTK